METPSAKRVVVTAPGFVFAPEAAARLRAAGYDLDVPGPSGLRTPDDVLALLRDADAAILSSDPVTASVLDACPNLRVISRSGVGYDSIDIDAATRKGVLVTTTPGMNDETCADHAVAMLLATLRRIPEHDMSVRHGEWDRGGHLTPIDLHHKRVAVIGYGRIGRCVVQRLQGFNTHVRVFDPVSNVDPLLREDSLEALLRWAQIVTIHVPLTPSTKDLIGAAELAWLGDGAVLVNTSRGGIVNEEALVSALTTGNLRAAALDVFEHEPPRKSRFHELPNVTLSPHVGGLSIESIEATLLMCTEQVLTALSGGIPAALVNPAALEALDLAGPANNRPPTGDRHSMSTSKDTGRIP